jgi:hypothetical protein
MDPKLVAIIEDYARTHGLNLPPHEIVSDMVASGPSGVEQLLALLGVTINAGDPSDNSLAQGGYTKREAGLNAAMTQFPASEQNSAAQMAGLGSGKDPMSEFSQLMQGATGIGQSLASSMTGVMQPFTQMAQQIPQQGMQAMQAVMGAASKGAGSGAAAAGALPGELAGAGGGLGGGAAELAGAAGGAGGLAGTTPAAQLGPPPTPSASTVPASSATSAPVPAPPPDSAGGTRGGMAGMPMVPPGAMAGAGGSGNDSKPDTKRVVEPSVKNGSPVQGRIVAPPPTPEVVKRVAGKPVAARRILAPEQNPGDDEDQTTR